MSDKGKQAGIGAGMFGGAGVSGLLALIFLSLAAVAALDTAMDTWLAALIVGVRVGHSRGRAGAAGQEQARAGHAACP